VRALTVLYDALCALCCAARDWLADQDTYMPIELIAAGSQDARASLGPVARLLR
jgi:predicted DCC family thiol-disulfide oxidoreductase YuxK